MDEQLPREMQLPKPNLTGASGVDAVPGEPQVEYVGEEQKDELRNMIEQIRSKLGEVNASGFAGKNMNQVKKSEILREIFSMLQASGIDLTNPQSVGQFIQQLRETNPEMAQLFEQAMDELLGGSSPVEGGGTMMPEESGQNMNNQNEVIQQTVRGPVPQRPTDIR